MTETTQEKYLFLGFTRKELVNIGVTLLTVILANFVFQTWISTTQITQDNINSIYLTDGIRQIETDVSQYGTATTIALMDIRREIIRLKDDPDIYEKLEIKLNEIRQRELVKKLLNRDYGDSYKAFPKLLLFDYSVYDPVKNTYYQYSRWLEDATDINYLKTQNIISESFIGEDKGLMAVTGILQNTELYLERRLRQLDDYILTKGYNSYYDFTNIKNDEYIKDYMNDFKTYDDKLKAWTNSMGENMDEIREKTSYELFIWINSALTQNPLD